MPLVLKLNPQHSTCLVVPLVKGVPQILLWPRRMVELTHVMTCVAPHPMTPPPLPLFVMVAKPAEVTRMTQVPVILVHEPLRTMPKRWPRDTTQPPPPPWPGKLHCSPTWDMGATPGAQGTSGDVQ